ncbi:ZIP family metal transporter [Candidatus Roizmanbacteria bacterium]|nr:MAG: ZIP family metal transporter [Candidatus Roizmanbacteria bacterium]
MDFFLPFSLSLIAGLSTTAGAGFLFLYRNISNNTLHFFLGLSAGVMLYLSFIELLPESIQHIGFAFGNLLFFSGILFMAIVDRFFPHSLLFNTNCQKERCDNRLYSTGVMVAIGLALHNFPEGVTVFMGSYVNIEFGAVLALAITLHNIPEGIAIAVPILAATKSKMTALKYGFLAGIIEPIGGLFAYFILRPYLETDLVYALFAVVAGVMVYISFDELLPVCFKCDLKHVPIAGISLGMILAALSILFLNG